MNAPTFKHIEEYIEFIGGYRTVDGKRLGLFDQVPTPLSLARYDVSVISSLASQTSELNNPYTDKQSALALRLVDKYRRQLAALNPSVIVPENIASLPFRLGIRYVDRSKSVFIEDNKFIVRFPYDTKLIDLIKKQLKDGMGSGKFNNDRKVWQLAMTEHMLNWIMAICPDNGFNVSDDVKALYDKLLACEEQEYKIELDIVGSEVVISNAPSGMLDYINDHLGGMSIDNLLLLVDNSQVLGYTISDAVNEIIRAQYPEFEQFICKRRVSVKKDHNVMDQVLAYARLVNRIPMHVYDTGLPKKSTDEVTYLNRGMSYEVAPKLLVTTTSLMIGSRKESWVTNAEKIIIIE
jgi:hypothetical protein